MVALFENRFAYLSVSLALLVAGFPLISIGTTTGPQVVWWLGMLALTCGALIPPVQRLWARRPLDVMGDDPDSDDVITEAGEPQKEPEK